MLQRSQAAEEPSCRGARLQRSETADEPGCRGARLDMIFAACQFADYCCFAVLN